MRLNVRKSSRCVRLMILVVWNLQEKKMLPIALFPTKLALSLYLVFSYCHPCSCVSVVVQYFLFEFIERGMAFFLNAPNDFRALHLYNIYIDITV